MTFIKKLKDKIIKNNKHKELKDIILEMKMDRRVLSRVPDMEGIRSNLDRRGNEAIEVDKNNMRLQEAIKIKEAGQRYRINYDVNVICHAANGKKVKFKSRGVDISSSGILLDVSREADVALLKASEKVKLEFEIEKGSMPEGYEMKVGIKAKLVRLQETNDGAYLCGFVFDETLAQYANKHRGNYMLMISSIFLFFVSAFIILMRSESVIYFNFNKTLYLYSIIAAIFLLSRYFFGAFYRPIDINPDFTPGVSIIIPCFNEEEWIERTIISCVNQDYPIDKLEVIVVDDCSGDNSLEVIKKTVARLHEEAERFKTKDRVSIFAQKVNKGKRDALAEGVKIAKHELVVFVDSDSFLDPFAIRNLVQPFQDPKMGGVSGRTDVANTYTNALTKMQSVRYYIAFRIMKAAEAYFDAVTCLSGPLSCYKKDIVLTNMDAWLNQRFLGQRATFGDDRSLTNFVLREHRTGYQDTAICSTVVPNRHKMFLRQQMRWKRSWLRESIIAARYIWKKEPFSSAFFYMGLFVPVLAPIIVLYNLVYIPIAYSVFPTTFLVGILMMALMLCFTQLLLRKSTTWLFGIYFVLYYETVLLWQMPVAWFTFWKTTWGTRMTPQDVEEEERRKKKISNIA